MGNPATAKADQQSPKKQTEAPPSSSPSSPSSSSSSAPTSCNGEKKPEVPRLYYFNICGRAEPIRLAFHYAQVPFDDIRVSAEQWGLLKPRVPYAQLPVLEYKGQLIAQTNAILRLVGRLTGLYPEADPVLAAKVDEVICFIDDISENVFQLVGDRMSADKRELHKKKLCEELLPRMLGALDRKFANGYIFGPKPTIADFAAFALIQWLGSDLVKGIPQSLFCSYNNLGKLFQLVAREPTLQDYFQGHTMSARAMVAAFMAEFAHLFGKDIVSGLKLEDDKKGEGEEGECGSCDIMEAIKKEGKKGIEERKKQELKGTKGSASPNGKTKPAATSGNPSKRAKKQS